MCLVAGGNNSAAGLALGPLITFLARVVIMANNAAFSIFLFA
jgi:hypothetical protein